MSVHIACTCLRKRGDYSDLGITMRNCNYSAFNGYRRTHSDYSHVICLRHGCMGSWRTKAQYVDNLPDVDYEYCRQ